MLMPAYIVNSDIGITVFGDDMSGKRVIQAIAAASLLLGFGWHGAAAQTGTEQAFTLELNAATEANVGSCRLTYVAENDSDIPLERTEYEVAIFDDKGVVSRILVLKFGALVEGKTKILQFDLSGTSCDSISRIVVNDSAACLTRDGGESDFCMSGIKPSSRTPIDFGI